MQNGTLGVIDGHYEYVIDLKTRKGALRPLDEAQFWDLDRSTENPSQAEALRTALYSRFPDLLHN